MSMVINGRCMCSLMAELLHSPLFSWPDGYLLFLIVILALSFLFPLLHNDSKQPPSPWRLPIVGNLHQLGSLPHRSLRALAQRYGPVMLLHLGRIPTIVVSSADAAQDIIKTQAFAARSKTRTINRLFYGGRSVGFAAYGDYWRQMRRVYVLHLLSLKRVQSSRRVRQEEVALLVGRIRAAAGRRTNMSEMIYGFTRDLVCRIAFGKKHFTDEDGGGNRFHVLIKELMLLLGAFPMRDYLPWLGWIDRLNGLDARVGMIADEIDAFLEKVVEEHIMRKNRNSGSDCEDIIDVLLSLDSLDGEPLDRESIKGIMMDMLAGGIDTVMVTAEWAMAELIKHPKLMSIVRKELQDAVAANGSDVGEVAEGVEFLRAVIKETLRIHPPGTLLPPRVAIEDAQLQGYHIPKGTTVIINAWAIGTDPNTWEKAEEFWPQRFLQGDNHNAVDIKEQGVDFVPFGGGRRGCPGVGFSLAAVEIALANLVYFFDWELPDGMNGEEMDMSESSGVAVRVKSGLILVPKPRCF